jgi:molecular chaperone DnaK (HSP70)
MIATHRRDAVELIGDALRRSGLVPERVDRVIRTGGSSSIPLFVNVLGELFGANRVAEHALFTGVALGLAARARQLDLPME